MRITILMILATILVSSDAMAQACIGGPLPRQLSVGARAELTEVGRGFGGEFLSSVGAGLSIGAGFSLLTHDDLQSTGTRASAVGAFEVPSGVLSICPAVGVSYANTADLVSGVDAAGRPITNAYTDLQTLSVPLTVNVGTRLSVADGAYLIPFAGAGIIHTRLRGVGAGFELNEDLNTLGGNGGLLLGWENLYIRAAASATQAAPDPVLSIGIGLIMR